MIIFNTIQEVIDFLEDLDGSGLTISDDDDLANILANYDLDDDFHQISRDESQDIRSAVGGSERFD